MRVRSRRRFLRGSLALVGLGLAAGCGRPMLPWQQPSVAPRRVARIGFMALSLAENQPFLDAFGDELGSLGYMQGRDYAMEYRDAQAEPERLPDLAAELARLEIA